MWILLAVCWAPASILTFLVFKYTQAGEKVIDASEGLFYYLTYQSKWARKVIWKFIYNTFSWYLTNDSKLASLNCGYALLTENGETLQLSSKTDKHHRFQYQMYHYAALGIKFQDSLEGKRVLDLGCGRGGGCKWLYWPSASSLKSALELTSVHIRQVSQRINLKESIILNTSQVMSKTLLVSRAHQTKVLIAKMAEHLTQS
ncbi:hypothetical protein FGO68_gene2571 [Halteria grandinella]|uniref:Uncharacterized protein n=1 Tax=Halteria grandinella TaxID=5974 RepID=A0A8J8T2V6_HALGN|nr:hypothetical protein FGO68_gene2571 [Halteria grandinella]